MKIDKYNAFNKTLNSRKMFITVATVVLLSLIYYKLDRSILFLLTEEPLNLVQERIKLFYTFGQYVIILVSAYMGINQIGKLKQFNHGESYNSNEPED
jgi:choline-glycine betaine transporter